MGQHKLWKGDLYPACRRPAVLFKSEPGDLACQTTLCYLSPDTTSCISFPFTGWVPGKKDSVSLFFCSGLVISTHPSWSLQFHTPSYKSWKPFCYLRFLYASPFKAVSKDWLHPVVLSPGARRSYSPNSFNNPLASTVHHISCGISPPSDHNGFLYWQWDFSSYIDVTLW